MWYYTQCWFLVCWLLHWPTRRTLMTRLRRMHTGEASRPGTQKEGGKEEVPEQDAAAAAN